MPDLRGRDKHDDWLRLSKAVTKRLRHRPEAWERTPATRYEDGRVSWEDFSDFCRHSHTIQRIALTSVSDSYAATRVLAAICQRDLGKDRTEIFFHGKECLAIRAIQGHSAYGIGSRMVPQGSGWEQLLNNKHVRFLYHTTGMGEAEPDQEPGTLSPMDRLRLIAAEGLKPGKDAAGNGTQRLHVYFSAVNPHEGLAEEADILAIRHGIGAYQHSRIVRPKRKRGKWPDNRPPPPPEAVVVVDVAVVWRLASTSGSHNPTRS
jgi:RNA:NAD 2'-phosphotransferase (TPT1/KptA family)